MIRHYLESLWVATAQRRKLSFHQNVIYSILCILEPGYRLFFYCSQVIRIWRGGCVVAKTPVISVGNLSAGGAGKSVFCQFLLHRMPKGYQSALLLRGYKSEIERRGTSRVIADGSTITCSVDQAGDEAYMHAQMSHAVVIVGKDRRASAQLAARFFRARAARASVFVLDDGYQNHALAKNADILLLDARHPLENGHCFPAGRLREKDYSRADFIIFTHSDRLSETQRDALKRDFSCGTRPESIFFGRHAAAGYSLFGDKRVDHASLQSKKIGALAGIGSYQSFIDSLQADGFTAIVPLECDDHVTYTPDVLESIAKAITLDKLDAIVTTRKDWVKLSSRLGAHAHLKDFPIYVLDVRFEFLTTSEEDVFLAELFSKMGWVGPREQVSHARR